MQDCGMSCIKYLLFAFNFIFALSGVVLMVIGGCLLHDLDRFRAFLKTSYLAPPIVFTVVGIIVFVIAFVGCCGAVKESPCKLSCFAGLVFVIFISEVAVGILAYVGNEAFGAEVKNSMQASRENYDPDLPQDKKLWDEIQYGLGCCGVDGPDDWNMDGNWPASCCEGFDPKLHKDHLCRLKEYVYKTGCYEKLKQVLSDEALIVLGVGSGFAFIEVIGMILACMLASEISSEKKRRGRGGD